MSLNKNMFLSLENDIFKIQSSYENIKKAYFQWGISIDHNKIKAKQLNNLLKKIINKRKKRLTKTTDVFSEELNWATNTLLTYLCREEIDKLNMLIANAFINTNKNNYNNLIYMLYYIHPSLHELYYFDHFTDEGGYSNRLKEKLRYSRQGLKGLKTYLSKPGRKISDSYPKGCISTMSKYLYIHPTTIEWHKRKSKNTNLRIELNNINIESPNITQIEIKFIINICREFSFSFNRWLKYAPCAINSGPFFKIKNKKSHTNCFLEIIDVLSNDSQDEFKIKKILHKYYNITEY